MRLYVAAVCSIMSYGSEAWILDKETKRALNGANSKMVSVITGRTIHDEAKEDGRTYDVVAGMRATRLRWLGQILLMKEDRMVHKTVKMMHENRRDGDLLMDAPKSANWEDLIKMAATEKGKLWQRLVRQIKDVVYIEAAKGAKAKRKRDKNQKTNKKSKKKSAGKEATGSAKTAMATARNDDDDDEDDSEGGDEWVIKRRVYKNTLGIRSPCSRRKVSHSPR